MAKKTCRPPGAEACPNRAKKRGLCDRHYQQAIRGVIAMPPRVNRESVVRCDLRIEVAIDEKLRQLAKTKKEPRLRVATRLLEDAVMAAAK